MSAQQAATRQGKRRMGNMVLTSTRIVHRGCKRVRHPAYPPDAAFSILRLEVSCRLAGRTPLRLDVVLHAFHALADFGRKGLELVFRVHRSGEDLLSVRIL